MPRPPPFQNQLKGDTKQGWAVAQVLFQSTVQRRKKPAMRPKLPDGRMTFARTRCCGFCALMDCCRRFTRFKNVLPTVAYKHIAERSGCANLSAIAHWWKRDQQIFGKLNGSSLPRKITSRHVYPIFQFLFLTCFHSISFFLYPLTAFYASCISSGLIQIN